MNELCVLLALFEAAHDEGVVLDCVLAALDLVQVHILEAERNPISQRTDGDKLSDQLENFIVWV